jgi:8-oxo-dGTP pyrophosphatase MutT (NUDIX family)
MPAGDLAHVHLANGLAVRDGRVLLVASRYPNHTQPLWNLPGGRQQPGELLCETAVREVFEETGLRAEIRELAYVGESYDPNSGVHFVSATFAIDVGPSTAALRASAQDDTGDHVVAVEWVEVGDIASRIVVGVVREPLLAYLRGGLAMRYAGFHDAGITIEWPSGSA